MFNPENRTMPRRPNPTRLLALALRAAFAGLPVVAFGVAPIVPAHAAEAIYAFDLPADDLSTTLTRIADRAGVQLVANAELTAGKRAPAIEGTFTLDAALDRALAGSGLAATRSAGGLRLTRVAAGETALPAVTVTAAARESAYGPVAGYLATRSAAATKTDTPLAETPQSVSVVTADQVDIQNAQSMAEALRYSPGIQAETFGFEPRLTFIRIRGFDATTDGVYRDGLRMANPGFAVGYSLEPYGAERLEVPRGPGSVLYGQSAPGGLLNYVSKRPVFETFGEIEAEAGSFSRRQARFDLGSTLGDEGDFAYRLTGVLRDADTQVDFIDDDRIYLAPSLSWRPGRNTQLTILSHLHQDRSANSQRYPAAGTLSPNPNGTIPVNRFLGEPGVDRYNRTEYALGYLLEHAPDERVTLRQNARYYRSAIDDRVVYPTSILDDRTVGRSVFDSRGEVDGLTVDNQIEWRFSSGVADHTLLAGFDYQRFEASRRQRFNAAPPIDVYAPVYGAPIDTGPLFTNDRTIQKQVGVYLQNQIALAGWRLSLAGRYDWADSETRDRLAATTRDQDDQAFTGRFGLGHRFNNGVTPYVSYAESFLPIGGVDAAGNAFAPETGRQYEAGVKYQPPGRDVSLTAAYYTLERRNFTTTDPATFQAVQQGEARSKGVELEAKAALGRGFSVLAAYTYLDATITDSAAATEIGEPVDYSSRHTGSLWVDYSVRGLTLGVGARHIGPATIARFNEFNRGAVPAVTLLDAVLRYDWKQMQFTLNAQNLLDDEYIAAAFTSGDLYATRGLGRVVTGSVRYRF